MQGNRVEGTIAAGNAREAIANLSAKELFPLKVDAAKGQVAVGGSLRVKSKFITPVYSQLASLLRSGVPMLRSLEVITGQASNAALRQVLEDVKARVEDGATLSEAMSRHPRAFSNLATSIVRAGSEGGFLEEALERVAIFTDQQDDLKAKVVGAMVYPMVLITIGTLVVGGLIIFAVPMVEDLFDSRDQLPYLTQMLLWFSGLVRNYGWLLAIIAIGGGYAIRQWADTDRGRERIDAWRTKLPLFGSIYLQLAVGRFCRVLGTLLKGGVPIVRSLDIAADSTGNVVLQGVVKNAAENISAGETLAEPLRASGYFPSDVVEMIAVAEQANSLEIVLGQISDRLDKTTWRKIELLVRLIEPLMLVALSAAVLMVAIALLLPIIQKSTMGV